MTQEERKLAAEMLIDGASFEEVGDYIGYTPENVAADLKRVLFERPRDPNIVFPALKSWVIQNCERSVYQLHLVSGISKKRLYEVCKGRIPPYQGEKETLAALTGIPADKLFEVD
jgi:hypothetical protein